MQPPRAQCALLLVACICRLLVNSLPNVDQLTTSQIPELEQLHLSSANNLMATIRILAPSAFAEGASSPDEERLSNLADDVLDAVYCLIDLQLFHLQRAALLAATIRRRAAVTAARQHGCCAQCPASKALSAVV